MNAETTALFNRCVAALEQERTYVKFEHEQLLAHTRDERVRRTISDLHVGRMHAIELCIIRVRRVFAEHAALSEAG